MRQFFIQLIFVMSLLPSCGIFFLSDGAGCFARGTAILTPEGPVSIENIRAGQEVYSWDSSSEKIVIGIVEQLIKHENANPWVLIFTNDVTLTVTPDHPVYLKRERKWIPVSQLKVGDTILGMNPKSKDASEFELLGINKDSVVQDTFNLKVRRYENSFAEGVLAHFY